MRFSTPAPPAYVPLPTPSQKAGVNSCNAGTRLSLAQHACPDCRRVCTAAILQQECSIFDVRVTYTPPKTGVVAHVVGEGGSILSCPAELGASILHIPADMESCDGDGNLGGMCVQGPPPSSQAAGTAPCQIWQTRRTCRSAPP